MSVQERENNFNIYLIHIIPGIPCAYVIKVNLVETRLHCEACTCVILENFPQVKPDRILLFYSFHFVFDEGDLDLVLQDMLIFYRSHFS